MTVREWLLAGALLALTTPAIGQAHRARRPAHAPRTVQLITMTSPAAAAMPKSEVEDSEGDRDAAVPVTFQVHDLSRRWVEFQMAQRLAARTTGTEPTVIAADDPFAAQPRAALSGQSSALPARAFEIPTWMQPAVDMPVPTSAFAPGCAPRPYRPTGFLRLDAETRRQTYYGMMSRIACEYGLPVGLFDAMIIRESRYDPLIVSPKNAFGLTQLMPGTASGLGVNRYDVVQNLRGGASYLRRQLDRFGQYHLALAAYNAGPGRVRGAVPAIAETRAYVDDILRNWGRLSGFERSVAARQLTGEALVARAAGDRAATLLAFR
jgi:soluble lytic murein transglycosylase-like protein